MKRLMSIVFLCVISSVFGLFGTSSATLWDRGGGLIYDDVLNITWLQDANYAKTSGYDSDGLMDWDESVAWADQLVYGGFDDWRLPTTTDGLWVWGYDGTTTGGYNITSSEMGYMYYVNLGGLGYYATDGTHPQPGYGINNSGPFVNVQTGYGRYWSGTLYAVDPSAAWTFHFGDGGQLLYQLQPVGPFWHAWAVRDGDLGAPIPEPTTMLLLGSGLVGIAGTRRKLKK